MQMPLGAQTFSVPISDTASRDQPFASDVNSAILSKEILSPTKLVPFLSLAHSRLPLQGANLHLQGSGTLVSSVRIDYEAHCVDDP